MVKLRSTPLNAPPIPPPTRPRQRRRRAEPEVFHSVRALNVNSISVAIIPAYFPELSVSTACIWPCGTHWQTRPSSSSSSTTPGSPANCLFNNCSP
ncbi:hypothetical protein QQF64_009301 [Cirrhinus molitorella]|uniref:Uncharacterized protein n=1 Tax=Cirrhinus molitorella TaxID=172907 RepID=A0ABR3M0T4_9TELE